MARRKIPQSVLDSRKLGRIWLTEWREYRHLTQEGLAKKATDILGMPITASTISRLEGSKSPYSQRQLEAFALALACEPGDILKPVHAKTNGHSEPKSAEKASFAALRLELRAKDEEIATSYQVNEARHREAEQRIARLEDQLHTMLQQFVAMEESVRMWLVALGHEQGLAARIASLAVKTAQAAPLPMLDGDVRKSTALRTEIAIGYHLAAESHEAKVLSPA